MSYTIKISYPRKEWQRRLAIIISIILHLVLLLLLLSALYQEQKSTSDLTTTMLPAPISIISEDGEEQSGVMPSTAPQAQQTQAMPQQEPEPARQEEPKPEEPAQEEPEKPTPQPLTEPQETDQKKHAVERQHEYTETKTATVELPQVRQPSRNKWLKKKEIHQREPSQQRPSPKNNQRHNDLYKKVTTTLSDVEHENITKEREYRAAKSFENEAYARSLSKALLAATRAYNTTIYSDTATVYKTTMILVISRNGKLEDLRVEPPCKNEKVNQALKEVCALAKFPPIPQTIQGDTFTLPLKASIELKPGFNPVHFTMSYDI